jgi:hypothetical protein
MRISWKIEGFALICVVITATYSCHLKPVKNSMDISDFIEKKDDLERFVNENFNRIEYEEPFSPLPGKRVKLVNNTDSLKFCTMSIQQCWVKKVDNLYAFFIIIKTSAEIEKRISNRYGKWETKAEISIQNERIGGDLFSWNAGQVKIDVSSYINILHDPRYEMCDLIVCRNMTYTQLLEVSDAEK